MKSFVHKTGYYLETIQNLDLPNQKDFPSEVLNKGNVDKTKTVFQFSKK